MRKNSPRKWLHAVLDLLPVILIPVFMIYSHRHTINDGSIQVRENKVVDFNQLIINGNFESLDNWYGSSRTDMSVNDNTNTLTLKPNSSVNYINTYQNLGVYGNATHKYLIKYTYNFNEYISSTNVVYTDNTNYLVVGTKSENIGVNQFIFSPSLDFVRLQFTFSSIGDMNDGALAQLKNVQVFDLSQMFGVGNEPSIDEFNNYFVDSYYEFEIGKRVLIDDYIVTYNDTDIMSQFTYQLYNSVDKYFNMGNVFNMNGVYDWFNLNIFGGNAPISIYIVWNIVLYEFVMDLLFLLYGLFMWFIDMVQHLMDKPFKSIK